MSRSACWSPSVSASGSFDSAAMISTTTPVPGTSRMLFSIISSSPIACAPRTARRSALAAAASTPAWPSSSTTGATVTMEAMLAAA